MDTAALAEQMLAACRVDGQAARTVPGDAEAADVRAALRDRARRTGLRIRTARLGDTVVVARTDAAIWHDDTATMRRKLTPPDGA